MKLPKYAIENHQFTIIFTVLLILTGIVSFITMPRSEDPQVSPAASSVLVVLPGANPQDIEELVVDPIEEVLNELEDIKHIRSRATDGFANIEIEFLAGSNADDKYSDVVQKVNSIRNSLPDQVFSLDILKWSVSDVNILQIGIVSDSADYYRLETEAERLEKMIEKVPGVKKAVSEAYPEREVRLAVDFEKMKEMKIPLSYVFNAIQSGNQNIPGGNVDVGNRRLNIQTSGSYESIEDIKNIVITAMNGKPVYLKDIADVHFDFKDFDYKARVRDKRAVYVNVQQKEGTNIFNIIDEVKGKIKDFEEKLPSDIHIDMVFDQSESVSSRLTNFFGNLFGGLVLVGIVVLLAVSFRSALIVMLAIPSSIFIGIGFVDFSGYGIEQMSIAGLVIALGLLVDNSIVVIENITRLMKLGYEPKEAAIEGTSQIAWPVVSSTATTVLAFVPIIMMQNITGDFIRSMPVTVVYTLIASLFVSLTLTPYLTSKFVRIGVSKKPSKLRSFLDGFIEGRYTRIIAYALRKPKIIVICSIIALISSLALFPLIGVSFFPKAEKPFFLINVEAPEGTNMDKTEQIAFDVEKILLQKEGIKNYTVNVGHGNPRIYYNTMPKQQASNHAQFLVQVDEDTKDRSAGLVEKLRSEFSEYPGAKIIVKEFEQGPPVAAPIEFKIIGDNLEILEKVALDVEEIFKSIENVINVDNPLSTSRTDLFVNINKDKAAIYGIPLIEIDRTVRTAIAGAAISSFRDPEGKEFDITVRLPEKEGIKISDFDKISVTSVTGAIIPLNQVASIEFKASPMKINHYKLERNVSIMADVVRGASVDKATKAIMEKLDNYEWPKNFYYYVGGEAEQRDESFGGMFQAVIIAMVGILGILVLQFRSYLQPWIVFVAIPLAIVGSLIALFVTGNSFSFTAFIGLTSLVGIVVNNSIILVDYTNQLRTEGKNIVDSLTEAAKTRFVPIILTTATTIGGLLPLTLSGGTMWAPMGWTIIGGLLISTLLTLIVVPAIYKLWIKDAVLVEAN